MTWLRRRVLLVIATLGVVLMLGGSALLVVDAQARAAAAQDVLDELVDFYATEQGYEVGARGPLLRSILADSISNDAPLPSLYTESSQDYVTARYGAFGGVFTFVPLNRPWIARMLLAPIAVGAVLLATAALLGAAGWTPRTLATGAGSSGARSMSRPDTIPRARTRGRTFATAALAVILLGGVGLVLQDARDRVAAAEAEVTRVSETMNSASSFTPSYISEGPFVRQMVQESLVNDAMPHLTAEGQDDYVSIRFGAFGTGYFVPVSPHPWTLRLVVVPLAAGLVLAVTATLVAAARWTPRMAGAGQGS